MEPWQHRFENHMNEAEMFMAESEYREAFRCFKVALNEVPEPNFDYFEATRAVVGIADCYYFREKFELAMNPLRDVMFLPDGATNPYIRLRRGQVFFHLGDPDAAKTEWVTAYLNGGAEVFDGETDCAEQIKAVLAELSANPGTDQLNSDSDRKLE